MEEKWIAHVGPHKVDIRKSVRDPRGIEDKVKEILEKDFVESLNVPAHRAGALCDLLFGPASSDGRATRRRL